MSNATHLLKAAAVRLGTIAGLLCWLGIASAADNTITVMTRNVDNGTDLGYIFAAQDQASFIRGMAATFAELKDSNFKKRAAALAAEIGATMPDLVALQEVTLWRTGPILQPPATNILYDQLDLLLTELNKRDLHYGVIAVQSEVDAEAPVPTENKDLRLTDRDIILARLDLPQLQFDLFNAQTHRFQAAFAFGNPILGQITVPSGWLSVDGVMNGSPFRFVDTHLQTPIAGIPEATAVQLLQTTELLASLASSGMPVILAGDFNANAEIGNEHTLSVEQIVAAGFTDAWHFAHPFDPGYTWPLFGEDQNSGPTVPSERIDLVFSGGTHPATVVTAERTGMTPPFASDHAGVVVKLKLP
jgi:endonuclease/exonuclease/phosphatase family metal-dependent hydrolase